MSRFGVSAALSSKTVIRVSINDDYLEAWHLAPLSLNRDVGFNSSFNSANIALPNKLASTRTKMKQNVGRNPRAAARSGEKAFSLNADERTDLQGKRWRVAMEFVRL